MKFIEEKTVLETHRGELAKYRDAIDAGWVAAQAAVTHVHVSIDLHAQDLFVFEVCNSVGATLATLEVEPGESPESVCTRARNALENL